MVKMLWLSISLIFAMGGCYVTNVTKIGKDKSYDTHAYKDTTHKVILRFEDCDAYWQGMVIRVCNHSLILDFF